LKIKRDTFVVTHNGQTEQFGRVQSLFLCNEEGGEHRSVAMALLMVYEKKGTDVNKSLRQQFKPSQQISAINASNIQAIVNFVPQDMDWMIQLNSTLRTKRQMHWTDWEEEGQYTGYLLLVL
jgi:hypothetical protein